MRVVVSGGCVVGSARRVAQPGEWRTNAALGATVEPAYAPPLACELALAAVEAVGGDLAGVDLLPTRDGFVVIEVNGADDFRPVDARVSENVSEDAIGALRGAVAERRPALAVV